MTATVTVYVPNWSISKRAVPFPVESSRVVSERELVTEPPAAVTFTLAFGSAGVVSKATQIADLPVKCCHQPLPETVNDGAGGGGGETSLAPPYAPPVRGAVSPAQRAMSWFLPSSGASAIRRPSSEPPFACAAAISGADEAARVSPAMSPFVNSPRPRPFASRLPGLFVRLS